MAKKEMLGKLTSNTKFTAVLLTVFILTLLLISGSAQALILKLIVTSGKIVQHGENIIFEVSVDSDRENPEVINHLVLRLDGPRDFECKFKKDGEKIIGCDGITIEVLESDDCSYGYDSYNYGYCNGYGYGYGQKLKFKIILNTSFFSPGTYKTEIISYGVEKTTANGDDITILPGAIKEMDKCSIRAQNGNLEVEGIDFGNKNKINLYLPYQKAKKGSGYLRAQDDIGRLTYKFELKHENLLENDENHTIIAVSGVYRLGRVGEKKEKVIIFLDKKNRKLSINGLNINVEFMNVEILEGCKPKSIK